MKLLEKTVTDLRSLRAVIKIMKDQGDFISSQEVAVPDKIIAKIIADVKEVAGVEITQAHRIDGAKLITPEQQVARKIAEMRAKELADKQIYTKARMQWAKERLDREMDEREQKMQQMYEAKRRKEEETKKRWDSLKPHWPYKVGWK